MIKWATIYKNSNGFTYTGSSDQKIIDNQVLISFDTNKEEYILTPQDSEGEPTSFSIDEWFQIPDLCFKAEDDTFQKIGHERAYENV